jgi:hypothetical protein
LEDLSPEVMKSLLGFCQLDDSPEVWTAFQQEFDPEQTRHRRAAAAAEEIEVIRRWVEPTMHWLGYSL